MTESAGKILELIQQEKDRNNGFSPTLEKLWRLDYEYKPVGIREFIESSDYIGGAVSDLHDVWKEHLEEIFDINSQVTTVILTGAIGTGKTTVASICLLYKCYMLTCLKDPARFYGLLPGSKMVFGIFNITLDKADTGYEHIRRWIVDSPYFQNYCQVRTRPKDPIFFPSKNIEFDVGSLDTHALGENMFSFMMDEANFFKKTPDPAQKSRAHQLFIQARTRLISRYMRFGKLPGIIVLISSKKYQSSFLEEQLEIVESDPQAKRSTRVIDMALWEAKPSHIFCGDKFSVAIGDESADSRILEDDELAIGHRVVNIPVEFRQQFMEDVNGALMNIAGISTVGSYSFITSRSSVHNCVDVTRVHPFDSIELCDVGINIGSFRNSSAKAVEDHLQIRQLCSIQGGRWEPLVNPGSPRWAHVDIGLTGDALGLCVGHVSFLGRDKYVAYIDLMIRIRSKMAEEVDLDRIVDFFVYLRKRGFRLRLITFDTFESRMAIQRLTKLGFNAGLLSIKLQHYAILRRMLFQKRISYYHYQPVIDELIDLRRGEEDKRPNHPPGGSDDISDALAGVVYHCSELEEVKPNKKTQRTTYLSVPLAARG